MLKKAMIMAAGVGSRLGALTNIVPKPLVPLANTPAMDILINHIQSFGIKNIIANTFYKSEQIQEHYKNSNIEFIKEEELSGTAGGVKKCQFFFDKDEDFIILSGDGLTDLDIEKAYFSHKKSNAIATIVAKEVEHNEVSKYGIIVTDENGFVASFQEKPPTREAKSNLANTGIYIFNYKIFNYIPSNTFYDFAKNVFPSVLNSGEKINTYIHYGYWSDIGSIEQYKKSNADIINHQVKSYIPEVKMSQNGLYVSDDFYGTNFVGNNVIGQNCVIGKNCIIKNSVLWDNIKVEDNITIENSIILTGSIVTEPVYNTIISEENSKVTV